MSFARLIPFPPSHHRLFHRSGRLAFVSRAALILLAASVLMLAITVPSVHGQAPDDTDRASDRQTTCAASSLQPPSDAAKLGERLRPATLSYDIAMTFGEHSMQMEGKRHVERAQQEGASVWRITDASSWDRGSTADTVEVDRLTLRPRRRVASGQGTIRLNFADDRVTGVVSQGRGGEQEIDVRLSEPVYGSETALEMLVAALPLVPGYGAQLRTFVPYTQSTRLMNLCVTGTADLDQPDGSSQTLLVVEITPTRGDGTEHSRLHVLPDAPHYVVQGEYQLPESAGSGTITMTLNSLSGL
jgi:hypothetical protein